MLKHAQQLTKVHAEKMRGGKGTLTITHLLEENAFFGKGRMFAHNILPPGSSVGVHKHENDFEVYYFIKGTGMYTDQDKTYPVGVGDVTICEDGHVHGVENTGTEALEFIALILYTK